MRRRATRAGPRSGPRPISWSGPARSGSTWRNAAALEASQNHDVYGEVEGQTTIISIVPEGTRVKKGIWFANSTRRPSRRS